MFAVVLDQHVGRLHVAVNQTTRMGGVEPAAATPASTRAARPRSRGPRPRRSGAGRFPRPGASSNRGCPPHPRHDRPRTKVRRDCARRREPRLPLEPLAEPRDRSRGRRDQLQRALAVQRQMMGPVDDPHPTAADLALDPVAGEHRAAAGIVACGSGSDEWSKVSPASTEGQLSPVRGSHRGGR